MSDNPTEQSLNLGADGRMRCWWCGDAPDYVAYHDDEWGRPQRDDTRLFEKLCLEGFQSGLSWLTILRKRENFRAAFAGFDIPTVAAFGDKDVARLLADPGVVRHRGKIEAAINNAGRALALQEEVGSLADYFWGHQDAFAAERPPRIVRDAIPSQTPASKALAKDLRARGWTFVGPTTVYAFIQSIGVVDDHIEGCFRRGAPTDAARG